MHLRYKTSKIVYFKNSLIYSTHFFHFNILKSLKPLFSTFFDIQFSTKFDKKRRFLNLLKLYFFFYIRKDFFYFNTFLLHGISKSNGYCILIQCIFINCNTKWSSYNIFSTVSFSNISSVIIMDHKMLL